MKIIDGMKKIAFGLLTVVGLFSSCEKWNNLSTWGLLTEHTWQRSSHPDDIVVLQGEFEGSECIWDNTLSLVAEDTTCTYDVGGSCTLKEEGSSGSWALMDNDTKLSLYWTEGSKEPEVWEIESISHDELILSTEIPLLGSTLIKREYYKSID